MNAFHIHARGTICPLCNVERKPTGSVMLEAFYMPSVRLPNGQVTSEQVILAEQIQRELDFDPEDDSNAFYNKPDAEERYLDTLDRINTMAENGDLPPNPNTAKVLEAALSKE